MHKEILSENQTKLLPLVKSFSPDFGLAGGTAIALYLGHRRSIDFDLFTNTPMDNERLFREQLSFFEDIDYSEEIEYLPNKEVSNEEVKRFLSEASVN